MDCSIASRRGNGLVDDGLSQQPPISPTPTPAITGNGISEHDTALRFITALVPSGK